MDETHDTSWLDADLDGSVSGDLWKDEGGLKPEATPSAYGLRLDKWGQRRGEDLVGLGEFKAIQATPEDAADMFGMAFDYEPQINDRCQDPYKTEFLKSMLENEDYQALRPQTQLDNMASELAALKFNQEFTVYKTKRKQEDQQRNPNQGPPSEKDQLRQEMKTAAAVGRAIDQAKQEVQELNDGREALGIGSEGGGMSSMSPQEVKKMFQRVKNNAGLRQMLELAGRYRLVARAKQRTKVVHGYDDMIGIVVGNDIGRLLPAELAALAHPVLHMDAIRRFTERAMMQREYQGVKNVAKGPILVIVDESGSMNGQKIIHAKALALTMAWVARQQKRWCGFISFSGRGHVRGLALPPDKWPTEAVMKWLEGFIGGGTDLPLKEIPKLYEQMGAPKGKTDLICITDGDTSPLQPNEKQAFEEWRKRAQCKFIGITIASPAMILQSISDEFYRIPALTPDNEAVERVLSI